MKKDIAFVSKSHYYFDIVDSHIDRITNYILIMPNSGFQPIFSCRTQNYNQIAISGTAFSEFGEKNPIKKTFPWKSLLRILLPTDYVTKATNF